MKNKRLIFLIFLIFTCLSKNVWAFSAKANSKSDSLRNVIASSKHDTIKINALFKLAWNYYLKDLDTTLIICKEAERLSRKNNYKKGISESYAWNGYISEQKGKIAEAMDFYRRSIPAYEEVGNADGISISYNNIGKPATNPSLK